MICHECARDAAEESAVAVCRFCMVGLCKQHLVELYRDARTFPQFDCRHQPAHPFTVDEPDQRGTPEPSRRQRPHMQLAPAPGI